MLTSDDIKALRESKGWSQQQMADELGVNQATVSRIERGSDPPGPVKRLLAKMAAETGSPTSADAA